MLHIDLLGDPGLLCIMFGGLRRFDAPRELSFLLRINHGLMG